MFLDFMVVPFFITKNGYLCYKSVNKVTFLDNCVTLQPIGNTTFAV